jgi:hypothetical protein
MIAFVLIFVIAFVVLAHSLRCRRAKMTAAVLECERKTAPQRPYAHEGVPAVVSRTLRRELRCEQSSRTDGVPVVFPRPCSTENTGCVEEVRIRPGIAPLATDASTRGLLDTRETPSDGWKASTRGAYARAMPAICTPRRELL